MAHDTFTFFGVEIPDITTSWGETAATWFGDQAVCWKKGGKLYRFYIDKDGLASKPHSTGIRLDHGVKTTEGQYLFVWLMMHWARDDDMVLQKLQDGEPHGQTQHFLTACSLTQGTRKQGDLLSLHIQRFRTRNHQAIRFLADPDTFQPEHDEYWGAWGMPNGQMVVGPWSRLVAELDGLRRSSWHTLTLWQRQKLVTTLVKYSRDDVPRDVKVDGLKAFYQNMLRGDQSAVNVRNARSNTRSWAEMYFGLDRQDTMALPWV